MCIRDRHEKIVGMLKGAGLEYKREARLDIAHCRDLPVSLVFLPAADIATYVGEGDVDMGITGEDIIAESEVDVIELMRLGMGKCRLSVQAPSGTTQDPRQLAGKRVVTSFPVLTKKYFASLENGEETKVKCISGSVEASCGLGSPTVLWISSRRARRCAPRASRRSRSSCTRRRCSSRTRTRTIKN